MPGEGAKGANKGKKESKAMSLAVGETRASLVESTNQVIEFGQGQQGDKATKSPDMTRRKQGRSKMLKSPCLEAHRACLSINKQVSTACGS